MVRLINDVKYIHEQGGFEIRSWHSNSNYVLQQIGAESSTVTKNMACMESATEKVVGMHWDTNSDCFTFVLNNRLDTSILDGSKVPTKREVLRTLMMIYDPLGLISFFLVFDKVLLQEIWCTPEVDWHDPILNHQHEKLMEWTTVLRSIESIRIPRWYGAVGGEQSVELNTFVDASQDAYAAVAFFRFPTGKCVLVGSKSRVAP